MAETLKYVTPIGQLNWLYITGEGKKAMEPADYHEYTASLILDKAELNTMATAINNFFKANTKPNTKMHWPNLTPINEMDGKTPEYFEAGDSRVIINAKTRTTFQDGKKKIIKTFNASGKEFVLPEGKMAGNGSKGRLNVTLAITSFNNKSGVSIYLNSVQFTKFVEYEEDSGFDAVDGVEDDGTSTLDMPEGTDSVDAINDEISDALNNDAKTQAPPLAI